MSERLRAPPSHPSTREGELSPEALRRRLEGRLEVLEAARKRYATLEKRLAGLGWKHRLRVGPGLIQEVLEQEETVAEAVARASRRAEVEGWELSLPALKPLREAMQRRARVAALVRQRLEELTVPLGEPELKTDLALLRKVLLETSAVALAPEETRILEMRRHASIPPPLAILIFFLVPFVHLTAAFTEPGFSLLVVGVFISLLMAYVLRAGEFWLTSERLIWKPVVGEPVSVSLRSIRPGGIQVERLSRSVRVQGDRIVHVRYVEPAEKLAALLEMHRQPPFLGASRGGLRLPQVSIYGAALRGGAGARTRHGLAVLRPQGVSFVPHGTGSMALRSITGEPPPEGLKIELSWVLEELRWLPEAEFDVYLARVVEATGGVHWSAWESRRAQGVPVWKEIHITHGQQSLIGKVDWSQQAAAERVFESWPSASES